jgi:hypothetical protein
MSNIDPVKYICSPACTELETVVTDWGAKLFALSPDFYNTSQLGGGVLQVNCVEFDRPSRLTRALNIIGNGLRVCFSRLGGRAD